MARRPTAIRRRADRAVPRHAGGRARRRRRTRSIAYRSDLDDLVGASRAPPARRIAKADTDDLRGYLGRARRARLRGLVAGAAAVGDAPALSLPLRGGQRGDDPAAVLEGPKRGRSLPKVLSIAEVDALLAQARADAEDAEQPPARGCARRGSLCLLEVLYATGLRVSELVALPASAARRDQRMLVVRGKGGKERLVPLNDAAKRAMTDYLALRAEAKRDAKSKWLFPSFGESGHLTPPAFRPRIEGARRGAAGIAPARLSAARAAPRLRQPSAAERRRSARGADAARPRRHLDHADLHPRAGRAAARRWCATCIRWRRAKP